jgi:hypothetical protein
MVGNISLEGVKMKAFTQPIKDDILDDVRSGKVKGHMVLVPFRAVLAPQSGTDLYHKLELRYSYLLFGMTGSWSGSVDAPFFRMRDISLNMEFSDSSSRGGATHADSYDRFTNLSPSYLVANRTTGLYHEYRIRHLWRRQSQINIQMFNESSTDTITASLTLRLLKFGGMQ